jgi:hypothetical protein
MPGATIMRLDAAAECDALLPASAPAPVVVRHDPPAGGTCTGGISDGTGAVALSARDAAGTISWRAYDAGGAPRSAFAAAQLASEPRGWHGLRLSGDPQSPRAEHVDVEPDGTVTHAIDVSFDPARFTGLRYAFSQAPAGGCFVLSRAVALAGNHWHVVNGRRFDEQGGAQWPDAVRLETGSDPSSPLFMAGGVSTGGEALFVRQQSAFIVADWLDASGATLATSGTAERSADVVGDALRPVVELRPLLDRALAVRADGLWRRAYPRLATRTAPLPDWLAARRDWTYRVTRGNGGYAAFPSPGLASADCTQSFDLIARSGRLCGRVTLREGGTGCTSGAVDQGWDGTVVQQSGHDPCTFRWWPRLLAAE